MPNLQVERFKHYILLIRQQADECDVQAEQLENRAEHLNELADNLKLILDEGEDDVASLVAFFQAEPEEDEINGH